jgi:cephalosporin hydroxylase
MIRSVTSASEKMLTLPPLAIRALRRAGRARPFERPAVLAEDALEELLFLADLPARRAAQEEYRALRSRREHYEFSNRYFGPHQIEAEILALLDWASEIAPRSICEIGTAMGGTTYLLGQSLPSVQDLIGVDLHVRRQHRLRFFSRSDQRLTFFDGSSYAPETVERVSRHLNGRKLDLLFIDGDHSFNGVASDFAAYRHFVRDGGIIVCHDIVEDYTTRYGKRTPRDTGGVPRFWKQIKPHYSHKEFVDSPEQDGFGIGALVYDSSVSPSPLG